MTDRPVRLEPRAWLLWGLAAGVPPLVGRNPFVLGATLLAVLAVRTVWVGGGDTAAEAPNAGAWRAVVRLAVLFAAIGVVFNVLTVHAGDRVFARIPDGVWIVGGPLTLNALVYGVLSGLAILILVLVGTTLGAVVDGVALLRLLPARLATVAVAGSVAWAFVPQTAAAFGEIREAQAARGFRPRGLRDLLPLVVPLLTNGLERALTLAEALESRGFGAVGPAGHDLQRVGTPSPKPETQSSLAVRDQWPAMLTALGLTGGAVGAYLLAVGQPRPAVLTLGAAACALGFAARASRATVARRTRYRPHRWTRADRLVAAASAILLIIELTVLRLDPSGFRYEPYPSLAAPRVNLLLLAALALLLAPVIASRVDPKTDPAVATVLPPTLGGRGGQS